MVVYIVTFVVFALILLFSYRALGGEPASDEQVAKFLENVVEWVQADAASVDAIKDGGAISDDVVEKARDVRKKISGYQQQLARLDPEDKEASRALSSAIESLGWACRMVESGSYQINPAVAKAAASLYASAVASVAEASALRK